LQSNEGKKLNDLDKLKNVVTYGEKEMNRVP
jgi:hypothetical protein